MFSNSGINRAILVGNIFGQPEWQVFNNQKCLCFQLVTTEVFARKGISQEHAEYHHIKISANLIGDDIESWREGVLVYLEGKIVTLLSTDPSGIRRYDTNIIANKCNLMQAPTNQVVAAR
jgi:single-strand DNA-binding protein